MGITARRADGYLAAVRLRIESRFASICSVGSPRRPSLAPSSTTSRAIGFCRSQSSRRKPPALVSPLTPAFTTSTAYPAESASSANRAGHDWLGESGSPIPSVRLVPSMTTRGRDPAAAARGSVEVGMASGLDRDAFSPDSSGPPHAVASARASTRTLSRTCRI